MLAYFNSGDLIIDTNDKELILVVTHFLSKSGDQTGRYLVASAPRVDDIPFVKTYMLTPNTRPGRFILVEKL